MINKIAQKAVHILSGNRKMYYGRVAELAKTSTGKVILEIGSGKAVNDEYTYSARHLFPDVKDFIMTDINPDFGHKILDITKMNARSKYDVVLCLNVLEHVYDFQLAVDNLYRSLKKGGQLVIAVPFVFPLHDEPGDYWRFTEHALRRILKDFSEIDLTHQRSRRLPTGYFVIAKK